jgi:hypothetical protein
MDDTHTIAELAALAPPARRRNRHGAPTRHRCRLRHHGAKLSGGNGALALLGNTLPTGAMLAVPILISGPVSGAHFNSAVALAFTWKRDLPWREAGPYMAVRTTGAILGVWIAHMMFDLPVWQLSATPRTGPGQWFSEIRRHIRPVADDLRMRRPGAVSRRLCGRPLHHGGLSVHGLDILRQPDRHLRRHRAGPHAGFRAGSARRNDRRDSSSVPALASEGGMNLDRRQEFDGSASGEGVLRHMWGVDPPVAAFGRGTAGAFAQVEELRKSRRGTPSRRGAH